MNFKTISFICFCLPLLMAGPAMAADGPAAKSNPVMAQVAEKTIRSDGVALKLRWLGKSPAGEAGAESTVDVTFKTGAKGCPDITAPANRKKLAALGAEPGDILAIKLKKGSKGWRALEVFSAASDRAVSFPGREKITPGLVAELLTPGSKAPVIATLATKATGEALKRQIEKLMQGLPPGSFEPGVGFEKLPVLTGSASLPGLMALAACPLVKTIQSDQKALPAAGQAMPMTSGEVLK